MILNCSVSDFKMVIMFTIRTTLAMKTKEMLFVCLISFNILAFVSASINTTRNNNTTMDPCDNYISLSDYETSLQIVKDEGLLEENITCDPHTLLFASNYYHNAEYEPKNRPWYRFNFGHGRVISTNCTDNESCPKERSISLKDEHPKDDKIVSVGSCMKGASGKCCDESWGKNVSIKYCMTSEDFYIYQLPIPEDCRAAYCTINSVSHLVANQENGTRFLIGILVLPTVLSVVICCICFPLFLHKRRSRRNQITWYPDGFRPKSKENHSVHFNKEGLQYKRLNETGHGESLEEGISKTLERLEWVVGWELEHESLLKNNSITVFINKDLNIKEAREKLKKIFIHLGELDLIVYKCLEMELDLHGLPSEQQALETNTKPKLMISSKVYREADINRKILFTKTGGFFTLKKVDGTKATCLFTASHDMQPGSNILVINNEEKFVAIGPVQVYMDGVHTYNILGKDYNTYYDGMLVEVKEENFSVDNSFYGKRLKLAENPWIIQKKKMPSSIVKVSLESPEVTGYVRTARVKFKEPKSGLSISNTIFVSGTQSSEPAQCISQKGDCGILLGFPSDPDYASLLPFASPGEDKINVFGCIFGALYAKLQNEDEAVVPWSYTLAYPLYDFLDKLKNDNRDKISDISLLEGISTPDSGIEV